MKDPVTKEEKDEILDEVMSEEDFEEAEEE